MAGDMLSSLIQSIQKIWLYRLDTLCIIKCAIKVFSNFVDQLSIQELLIMFYHSFR